jgi:predicted nuclease with TOPRIM domain
MNFEQTIDRNKVEELGKERACLIQELQRATSNVERMQCRLAQCEEEILSLTDRTDTNRCAAIQLANEIPTQVLMSIILELELNRQKLEASLPTLSPEQAQEAITTLIKDTERLTLYCQVIRTRKLIISM